MFRKISLLVFLSIPLMILADDHGKKEGKSPKEMKKMEMMKKKKDDMMKEMERWGRWKSEDCKKVSEASGFFLYAAGEAMKEGEGHESMGHQEMADKLYLDALALAELAANYAVNYDAYCKR